MKLVVLLFDNTPFATIRINVITKAHASDQFGNSSEFLKIEGLLLVLVSPKAVTVIRIVVS